MRSLIVLMMILLIVSISNSQTAVINPGMTWTNNDTISYFAISRMRSERMLVKSELYDTTFALLQKEAAINQRLRESNYNWKIIATASSAFIIGVVIWEAVR